MSPADDLWFGRLIGDQLDDSGSHAVVVDWAAVESWLGLRLPADYREMSQRYGPLDLGEFVWLHTPCVAPGRFDYGEWLRTTHRLCRAISREAPPHEPPPFHPEPGGLLAWGTTRASMHLFWDTGASDDPDAWPTVVLEQDAAHLGHNPWMRTSLSVSGLVRELMTVGMVMPSGRTVGPLPGTARRTAWLRNVEPWAPPPPDTPPSAARLAALTSGQGIAALRALVPPPTDPSLGERTWADLAHELGTELPADYYVLLDTYGAGTWSDWLTFSPPLRGNTFVQEAEAASTIYRELRAEFPEWHPLKVWPEPGGFLFFASSVDGDQLGWLTEGDDPDQWPLTMVPRHADQGPPLATSTLQTVLDWMRGRAPGEHGEFPALDPLDDPLEFATFSPWNQ